MQFNPGQEPGTGCLSLDLPCRVPFGSSDVNITSYVLVSRVYYGRCRLMAVPERIRVCSFWRLNPPSLWMG